MIKKSIYLFAVLASFSLADCRSQTTGIDPLEFQPGYPKDSASALSQLESFPSPRYKKGNDLIRLFNWMNPNYMGSGQQPGIKAEQAISNAFSIQEELILHWNYFIFIPNSTFAFNPKTFKDPKSVLSSYVKLANKYPDIPLGTTIFWMQLQPQRLGFEQKKANVIKSDLPDKYYVKDASGKVSKRKLNFAAPDSLFIADGRMQKQCLQNLLNNLTRPINLINENGEEPPGVFSEREVSGDADMIAEKEKMGIKSWRIYMSQKKQHFRTLYSSQFMSLPELKNTWFTVYAVEGGPIDRFDWNSTKKTNSQIKGNYYSTPDFYPRTPDNWRTWKGAWHGWKWINDGRITEISSGDRLFSPFVSAGWSNDPKNDIRPGQWLGLLKSLSVVGAEFYYVAYFNLKKPYSQPKDYVWQAVIPAYAQAITSRYTDVFRNGNVLSDPSGKPIVTYPVNNNDEKDLLVTVRKHDQKEQYIIAATVQHESNLERSALKKNAEITLNGTKMIIEARRQGSVYFLDKSVTPFIFYQLDKWHQYEHPSHWRKEMIFEAEVSDTSSSAIKLKTIYDESSSPLNLSISETFVNLKKADWIGYDIDKRDLEHLKGEIYLKIYLRARNGDKGKISFNGVEQEFKITTDDKWMWVSAKIPSEILNENSYLIRILSEAENMEIDKVCISEGINPPDLSRY
jgi:hypothetical protein